MHRASHFPVETYLGSRFIENRQETRRIMDRVLTGKHQSISSVLRFMLYTSITAAFIQGIVFATQYVDAKLFFRENGMVEWFHFGLLISCSALLQFASTRMPELRGGFHVLAVLSLVASVRELDRILDEYVFDGAWQVLVSVLVLYISFYAWVHRRAITHQLLRISSYPPTGLLVSGFITVMVFSRLLGQQLFWRAALQENYLRLVGRIVEESCELFGYLLLLFGCLEFVIFTIYFGSDTLSTNQHKRQSLS